MDAIVDLGHQYWRVKIENTNGNIFFYEFWKSFVYFVAKRGVSGSTFSAPRDLKFCIAVYISKKYGISFASNSSHIVFETP